MKVQPVHIREVATVEVATDGRSPDEVVREVLVAVELSVREG